MSEKIKIVEVGARDGLQNESRILSVATKLKLISDLADAGLRHIELGAFVSPKWVPQMADSNKVSAQIFKRQKLGQISKQVAFSALVPNSKGMELALQSNMPEVAVFGACSESFSKKNINCTINESFKRFTAVISVAKKNKIKVRGYLSMAFGCPYEGQVSQAVVIKNIQKMLKMGVYEVSVSDTIGVATPKQVEALLKKLETKVSMKKLAMHFHNTRGTALANVYASLKYGLKVFDSSVGGLGGCPYAKGASGNLATEDLVYMLHGMGYQTGTDLEKLIQIKSWVEKKVNRELPSHVGRSGPGLYA